MTSPSTARAVSPDSGEHWTLEGAWPAAPGVHRIPLPLPMDGLRAVNVYVLQDREGLTLVDGGWAIVEAREVLERSLGLLGAGTGDIRRFLVTHSHRDHYTMARVLGSESGAQVVLGRAEEPALELASTQRRGQPNPFAVLLRACGDPDLARAWTETGRRLNPPDPAHWAPADRWLEGDERLEVGDRLIDAVATPGHTPGHYVFADRAAGLLFAGDHVLPTITPSIGFTAPPSPCPLDDFMASLGRVLELPDLALLPAHGPVAPSTHLRVRELVEHHDERLALCLDLAVPGPVTSAQVAAGLPWTRHAHSFADLDVFNRALAAMETKAHLELLAGRGDLTRRQDPLDPDAVVTFSRP